MKILVAYYSRTGVTKKVAEIIAQRLNAEIEEIRDTVNRSGIKGYLLSGRDATKRILTKLEPSKHNPTDFDLVIIGTPIWSWNLSAPARTYATDHKGSFGKIAFFCTMGGSGDKRACAEMENIVGKKAVSMMGIPTKDAAKNNFSQDLERFLADIETETSPE